MKKVLLPLLFLTSSLAIFALRNFNLTSERFVLAPHNSGGAAEGKTGAPGEQNCTACHSGSAQSGANENILTLLDGANPVTEYAPGQQYTVTLAMTSNPTKKGFQATALTSVNTMAGTFTGQTGNTNISGTTKKYANHTITSNTSLTAPVWTWTWTAPSAGAGNVTFYVASNKANNNSSNSGDVIYLSQHVLTEASTSSVSEVTFNNNLSASWNHSTNQLNISFELNKTALIGVNIVDLFGKSVYHKAATKGNIGGNTLQVSSSSLTSGLYIVNLFIDNKPFSKKVLIP